MYVLYEFWEVVKDKMHAPAFLQELVNYGSQTRLLRMNESRGEYNANSQDTLPKYAKLLIKLLGFLLLQLQNYCLGR